MIDGNVRLVVACRDNRGLDAEVSASLARCRYLVGVDLTRTGGVACSLIEDLPKARANPGVIPRMVRDMGADLLLVGALAMRAAALLRLFRVDVATGARGTVRSAVTAWVRGRLGGRLLVPGTRSPLAMPPEGQGRGLFPS